MKAIAFLLATATLPSETLWSVAVFRQDLKTFSSDRLLESERILVPLRCFVQCEQDGRLTTPSGPMLRSSKPTRSFFWKSKMGTWVGRPSFSSCRFCPHEKTTHCQNSPLGLHDFFDNKKRFKGYSTSSNNKSRNAYGHESKSCACAGYYKRPSRPCSAEGGLKN
jgi:hypothetical protein